MTAEALPASPPTAAGGPTGPLQWRLIVDWLRADGVITAEQAQRTIARCSQAESSQHPLVRLGNVAMLRASDGKPLDVDILTEYVAQRCGLAFLRIDPLKVDVGRVADAMSASYAERHKVLPVQVTSKEVVVATAEPFLHDWVAEVERQSRRTVRRVLANPQHITRYTAEFYALAKSVREAQKAGGGAAGSSFEQLVELGKTNKQLDANDQGVVRVVDWLWQYAFDQRASDIHLEPRREQGVIRFRIDGVLHAVYQMPMGVLNAMVARVKLLGRMDVVEKRRPQDGRIKTRNPRGDEVEMRLSTLPTAFGEKMVMRIFDPDNAVKDLDALGFTAHDAQRWEQLVKRPHGIILVTGPTGSGKTTTLYATLLGVLAQRLVRTLCKQCKQPDTAAAPEALAEVVKPWKLSGTYQPYKAVGCVDCRMGGFLGRMGLYELLTVSEALKDKITQAPSIDVLRRQAVADGMRPLRLAGALRVAEGLTTLDEVVAGTPPLE